MAIRIRIPDSEPLTIRLTKPEQEVLRVAAAEHSSMEGMAGTVVKGWLRKQVGRGTRRAAKQVEQQDVSQSRSGETTRKRISLAETARLIRKQLLKAFPATRFEVSSNRWADSGPDISVFWLAGPEEEVVNEFLRGFTDEAWFLPDGSAVSTGYDIPQPHPEAIKVWFEPEAIVTSRDIWYLRGKQ